MVRRQKQARRAVMGSIVGTALAVLLMGCCWLMPDSRADASSHYRSRRGMPSRSQSRSHAHSHSNLHSRRGAGSSMVPDREYGYDDDNHNDNDNDNEEELELQQELELELGDTLWTPTTDWQASSSYSSSEEDAFVDVDDLTEHHRRRTRTRSGPGRKRSKPSKTKRGRSRETMERAERLLRALEEDDEVPRVAATAASQSTRRRSKAKSKLKSKSKSKSKRRRKTKKAPSVVATADLSGSSNSSNNNSSNNSSNNSRIRGVGPSPSRRSPAASATPATASASAAASRSAVASTVAPSKLSSPQEHPDRTTWEVPSYSHKISTMMKKTQSNQPANNINNNNSNLVHAPNAKKASAPATTATATARTTTSVPTASRVPPRSAPATKPSASRAAAPQASTGTGTTPWVRKFLAGRPRDRLLPLPRDYISDNFNLAQLPPIVERIGYEAMGDNAIPVAKALQQHRIAAAAAVAAESSNGSNTKPVSPTTKSTTSTSYPIYRRALRLILAEEGAASDADTDTDTEEDRIIPQHAIQTAAEALYLLLHARFVVSPRGLEAIRHVMALDNTVFGRCPRSTCHGTGLLPYGHSNDYTSDASGRSNAVGTTTTQQQQQQQQQRDARCHRYCPCCGEVWVSWDSKTDGCAWGPSWCHLFLLAFGTQVYATELAEAAARRANANANPNANANGVPAAATPSSYGVAPLVPPPSPLLSRAFLPRTQPRAGVVHAATTAPAAPAPRGHGDESEATSSRPTPSVFGFRVHPATAFGRPWNEPLVPSSLRGGGVGGGGAFYTNTNTGYYSSPSPYDYHHT